MFALASAASTMPKVAVVKQDHSCVLDLLDVVQQLGIVLVDCHGCAVLLRRETLQ